ncbi:restriction endonuclease [Streptomyces mirabilis]|uniref:restriction endonuclease n=1 Tax=Streptomyces mirabilis TaxID=68239 RepID=UPI0036C532AC
MSDVELRDLLIRYQQLKSMPRGKETRRGQLFNVFLRDLLRAWGLEAHSDQRGIRNRDETDVGFSIGRSYYILEAKWERKPINLDPVAKLYLRLKVRPPGTAAVLVSMSGFTKHVREFTEYHPEIILLDSTHIEAMLTGLVDPDQLLHSLFSWTSRRGGSHVALDRLLLSPYPPELARWIDPGDKLGISHIADGVRATSLLMTDEPDTALTFTGMTSVSDNTVRLTCDHGVMRLDLSTGDSSWELPLSGCFGPAVPGPGSGFLAACDSAVVRWDGRALTAVAGAFPPRSQLLSGPDGERWMFSTTGPTGHPYYGSHTLTRLGLRAGEEEAFRIFFEGEIKQAAITSRNTLYIASRFYAGDLGIADGMSLDVSTATSNGFPAAQLTEVTALHRIGEHTVLSAGRAAHEVALYATHLGTREHTLLMRISAAAATALAVRDDGVCFLLLRAWESDWLDRSARSRPLLLRIDLPADLA